MLLHHFVFLLALALPHSHSHALQIRGMAPKRGGGNAKKATSGVSHDKEWVPSLMGEMELDEMVEVGVLPNRVTARWRPANGEPYPMPHTDELVIFGYYF